MKTIDPGAMSNAEILMRLYNAAGPPCSPHALAWMDYRRGQMSLEAAQAIIDRTLELQADLPEALRSVLDIDYISGRIIKVRLDQRPLHVALYDRDHGEGAAARALGVQS